MNDIEKEQLVRCQIDQLLKRMHAHGELPTVERELLVELCKLARQYQREREARSLLKAFGELSEARGVEGGAE